MATNLPIENYESAIKNSRGFYTRLPVTLSGTASTLAVGGTSTFTGVATFTAAPVFTAAPTGPVVRPTAASAARRRPTSACPTRPT